MPIKSVNRPLQAKNKNNMPNLQKQNTEISHYGLSIVIEGDKDLANDFTYVVLISAWRYHDNHAYGNNKAFEQFTTSPTDEPFDISRETASKLIEMVSPFSVFKMSE